MLTESLASARLHAVILTMYIDLKSKDAADVGNKLRVVRSTIGYSPVRDMNSALCRVHTTA